MTPLPIPVLAPSWRLALEAENKSPKTIKSYTESLDLFVRWLDDQGHDPSKPVDVDTVRTWLVEVRESRSASTARTRWSGLRSFYAWAAEEQEYVDNPMLHVKAPALPEKLVPVLTTEQLKAVVAACEGPLLVDRRDEALVLAYADTGARLSEIVNAQVEDLDLRLRQLRVMGKGSRERVLPFGARTARALDRYLRIRARQRFADSPWLWLSGKDGRALTANAVYQMMKRRGRLAGVPGLHPHMFRHGFADAWLRSGGSESDLMELAGWQSRQMLDRYAKKTRAERARESYRSRSPMDQLG